MRDATPRMRTHGRVYDEWKNCHVQIFQREKQYQGREKVVTITEFTEVEVINIMIYIDPRKAVVE